MPRRNFAVIFSRVRSRPTYTIETGERERERIGAHALPQRGQLTEATRYRRFVSLSRDALALTFTRANFLQIALPRSLYRAAINEVHACRNSRGTRETLCLLIPLETNYEIRNDFTKIKRFRSYFNFEI